MSEHEATETTSAELYLARDLRLPVDLLRGNPPNEGKENPKADYTKKLKEKLDTIHQNAKFHLNYSILG